MQIVTTWDDILNSRARLELHSTKHRYTEGTVGLEHTRYNVRLTDGFLQPGEYQQLLLLCTAAWRRWSQTLPWGLQWQEAALARWQVGAWEALITPKYSFFNNKHEQMRRQAAWREATESPCLKITKNLTHKALGKVIKPDLFWAELNTMTSLLYLIILGT